MPHFVKLYFHILLNYISSRNTHLTTTTTTTTTLTTFKDLFCIYILQMPRYKKPPVSDFTTSSSSDTTSDERKQEVDPQRKHQFRTILIHIRTIKYTHPYPQRITDGIKTALPEYTKILLLQNEISTGYTVHQRNIALLKNEKYNGWNLMRNNITPSTIMVFIYILFFF